MSEEYKEGKKYTSSFVNRERTKIAHKMQKDSTPRSKALKKKGFDGTGKVSVQGSKPMRMMLS